MPLKIDDKYGEWDADSWAFLHYFNEPDGCEVLEVGANEEYTANVLVDNGYKVTGVDLRKYLQDIPCNYDRVIGEFNSSWGTPESFDCVYSLSALEHFGLSTYEDTHQSLEADKEACSRVYDILRPGGTFYVTVPFGRYFTSQGKHWRIYSMDELRRRIIGKFHVEVWGYFTSALAIWNDKVIAGYSDVPEADALLYDHHQPHVTVFLKMRKPA